MTSPPHLQLATYSEIGVALVVESGCCGELQGVIAGSSPAASLQDLVERCGDPVQEEITLRHSIAALHQHREQEDCSKC